MNVNKEFKFYLDKEKTNFKIYSYEDLIKNFKLRFVQVIKECNIDNKLLADFKHSHDKNLKINAKIKSLFTNTIKILDLDNKLSDKQKYKPKKYNDQNILFTEKFEKGLIEPNLWNKLDDYSRFIIDRHPNSDYISNWLNYEHHFIYTFIEHLMFYWGDGLRLPEELNPILPHLKTFIKKNTPDLQTYIFYKDKEKTEAFPIRYGDLVKTMKNLFLIKLKDLKINNQLSVEYNLKLTLYEKYIKSNPEIDKSDINIDLFKKLEPLYIKTLETLDIYDLLSDTEKYEPKKYNDQNMSLTKKLVEKELIEPNLWNRFDDYSKLSLEGYDFDAWNYDLDFQIFLDKFFDHFTTHLMFYWGDGLVLPEELNPIIPYLPTRRRFKPIK